MLHFHYSLGTIVITDIQTTFPYPCGVVEEALDIIQARDNAIKNNV
jgi:hypothetical protein